MIVTGYLIDEEMVESFRESKFWANERKYTGFILIVYASLRSDTAFKTKPIAVSSVRNIKTFVEYIKRE